MRWFCLGQHRWGLNKKLLKDVQPRSLYVADMSRIQVMCSSQRCPKNHCSTRNPCDFLRGLDVFFFRKGLELDLQSPPVT